MRQFSAEQYSELVEGMANPRMQEYMHDEQDFIASMHDAAARTYIDLGAGYGRVVPFLAGLGREVIAIEANPNMTAELQHRASEHANVRAVPGDFMDLPALLPQDLDKPVFLLLQNTIGTVEGDFHQALSTIVAEAKKRDGELVLSLFRAGALQDWGLHMYHEIEDMIGPADIDNCDFKNGNFVTKNGYTSKWWTNEDIGWFCSLGKVVRGKSMPEYSLIQLSFPD